MDYTCIYSIYRYLGLIYVYHAETIVYQVEHGNSGWIYWFRSHAFGRLGTKVGGDMAGLVAPGCWSDQHDLWSAMRGVTVCNAMAKLKHVWNFYLWLEALILSYLQLQLSCKVAKAWLSLRLLSIVSMVIANSREFWTTTAWRPKLYS